MYLIFKYDVKIMHYCICLYIVCRLVRQCAVVVVVDVFFLLFSIRVQSSLRFFRQCVRTIVHYNSASMAFSVALVAFHC